MSDAGVEQYQGVLIPESRNARREWTVRDRFNGGGDRKAARVVLAPRLYWVASVLAVVWWP